MGYAIAVAAVAVVLLTSFIKNVGWDSKTKHIIATGLSVTAAALVSWQQGVLESPDDFVQAAFSVYGLSQLIYNFVLSGTTLNERLEGASLGRKRTEVSEGEWSSSTTFTMDGGVNEDDVV